MHNKSFALLLLASSTVVAAFLWAESSTAPPTITLEPIGTQTVFAETATADTREPDPCREAFGSTSAASPDEDPAIPVIPAFWFYANQVRSIADNDALWREVRMPATALLEMSDATRRRLAVESLDGMRLGPVISGDTGGVQVRLAEALIQHWQGMALRTNEDLGGAAIQFADETIGARLGEANPPLLHLAMQMLGYFTEIDEAVQRFAPTLLAALHGIPVGVEPNQRNIRPVLQVLAKASWKDDRSWLRRQLLDLVAMPWMTKAQIAGFLMQLTSGASYATWAPDLQNLIASGSPAAIWGAIEALRGFAATREITPMALLDALPEHLLAHADATLRWALYELLATFGEAPGEALLTGLLTRAAFPFRPEVLSYLALAGKVSTETCVALLANSDPLLRNAAIDALGHLAKSAAVNLTFLVDLALGNADAEVRLLAVRSLGTSGRAEVLDLLQKALDDGDGKVQLEAIAQIGRFPTPQPERLLAVATTLTLPANCRALAYRELILDAADRDAGAVFRSMYDDPDADISAAGYAWQAALAVAKNDHAALESWRALPIPARVLQEVSANPALSAIAGAVCDIRSGVVDEVRHRLQTLTGSEYREAIAQKRTREHLFGIGSNTGIGRHLAYEERILRFLGP